MSNGKIERSYFEEKKQLSLDGVQEAQDAANEVLGLLSSWNYDLPNIFNAAEVHKHVHVIKAQLDDVRRNFEKVRWACANTDLNFDEWLIENEQVDLVLQEDHRI